jgi:N-carbamoyl-L-amino-acid hydrolase
VPTIMVFVRNEHRSHIPDEAMDMADFAGVIRLLANGSTLIS